MPSYVTEKLGLGLELGNLLGPLSGLFPKCAVLVSIYLSTGLGGGS